VIGMVGLIEDVRRVVQPGFKKGNDVIALLGITADDHIMSEYAVSVLGANPEEFISSHFVPQLDLKLERRVQAACLQAAEAGLLHSAHDCSDGGLAVAIAESCFSSLGRNAIGAKVELEGDLPAETLLFAESPSRIVITFDADDEESILRIAETNSAPFAVIGRVGGDRLTIQAAGQVAVDASVAHLEDTWRSGLTRMLQPEALAAS
jgi:phosphoribosylformylglycinamidine synthase subunit PurL